MKLLFPIFLSTLVYESSFGIGQFPNTAPEVSAFGKFGMKDLAGFDIDQEYIDDFGYSSFDNVNNGFTPRTDLYESFLPKKTPATFDSNFYGPQSIPSRQFSNFSFNRQMNNGFQNPHQMYNSQFSSNLNPVESYGRSFSNAFNAPLNNFQEPLNPNYQTSYDLPNLNAQSYSDSPLFYEAPFAPPYEQNYQNLNSESFYRSLTDNQDYFNTPSSPDAGFNYNPSFSNHKSYPSNSYNSQYFVDTPVINENLQETYNPPLSEDFGSGYVYAHQSPDVISSFQPNSRSPSNTPSSNNAQQLSYTSNSYHSSDSNHHSDNNAYHNPPQVSFDLADLTSKISDAILAMDISAYLPSKFSQHSE